MTTQSRVTRRAFTLLEALIVIAIVVLVLALTVGVLRQARTASISAKCLVNARTCSLGLFAYTNDHEEHFPWFAEHRRLHRAFRNGAFTSDYFLQSIHWPLVARQYLSDSRFLTEAHCPAEPLLREDLPRYLAQYPSDYIPSSGYATAHGTLADPAWWTEGVARQSPKPPQAIFRAVRLSEASFPADKGFMIERWAYHAARGAGSDQSELGLPNPQAARLMFSTITIDGSGAMRRPIDLQLGFRDGAPVLNTNHGIRGRDLTP